MLYNIYRKQEKEKMLENSKMIEIKQITDRGGISAEKGKKMRVLYDSTKTLGVEQRGGVKIMMTNSGLAYRSESIYSDDPTVTFYYHDYPDIPEDWRAEINESGTTELQLFEKKLKEYTPYRTAVER